MDSDEELARQLCELEMSLLTPAVRQSSAVSDLLADDFVEFGSSGNRWNKTEVVGLLRQAPAVRVTISEMRATRLDEAVFLITYRACRDGDPKVYSLRSSIWQFRSGRWQISFHQGTPVQTAAEEDSPDGDRQRAT